MSNGSTGSIGIGILIGTEIIFNLNTFTDYCNEITVINGGLSDPVLRAANAEQTVALFALVIQIVFDVIVLAETIGWRSAQTIETIGSNAWVQIFSRIFYKLFHFNFLSPSQRL